MDQNVNYDLILKNLESACIAFQTNPTKQNEQELIAFRQMPNIIPIASYILEHSKNGYVQFQAIAAILEAVIRDWANIPLQDIVQLRTYLLDFVSRTQLADYVVQKILQSVAIITKRAWLQAETLEETAVTVNIKGAFFQQLNQFLDAQNISLKIIGIDMCNALVTEFSSTSKSTPLDLPWEYHIKSLQTFEDGHLQQIFIFAFNLMQQIMNSNVNVLQSVHELRILFQRCLSLLSNILSWPFHNYDNFLMSFSIESQNMFLPGKEWRTIFVLRTDVLQFFFQLYSFVRREKELLVLAHQGLLQLASLTGDVFKDPQQKITYLTNYLTGLKYLMLLPEITPQDYLNISQIIERVLSTFQLESLIRATNANEFLTNFEKFTSSCLESICKSNNELDKNNYEMSLNSLLDGWSVLVGDAGLTSQNPNLSDLKECATKVFEKYINMRLTVAKMELGEENTDLNPPIFKDQRDYEDQLTTVAQLGRLNPAPSIAILGSLVQKAIENITRFLEHGPSSRVYMTSVLEELHWTLLIIGHFLCDPFKGQIPKVPQTLSLFSVEIAKMKSTNVTTVQDSAPIIDPIVTLIGLIYKLSQFEMLLLTNKKIEMWSPLLSETLTWFWTRWCRSYLLRNDHSSPTLAQEFGVESPNAYNLVNFLFQKVNQNLIYWTGEEDILKESCELLTAVALARPDTRRIIELPAWKELCTLYLNSLRPSQNQNNLTFSPEIHRRLAKALVTFDLGTNNEEKIHYLSSLIVPLEEALRSVLQNPEFSKNSQNPEVISTLVKYIETYRGIIQATTERNSHHIFASVIKFLEPFVQLISLYKDQHIIIVSLLKFVVDFCQMTLNSLEGERVSILVNFCITLFKVYADCGLGKIIQKSSNLQLQHEQEKEQYKQMLLLLKILQKLFQYNMITPITFAVTETNLSNQRPRFSNWVVEAAFYGLSIILPLVTQDILLFPKLSEAYFNVINSIFQKHVAEVHALPDNLFTSLVNSLQYGLHHTNDNVVCICIESIQALAGENSISLSPTKSPHVPRLLQFLFNFLLFENRFNMDFVLVAASCLLEFVKHQQACYQQVVEQIITQQKNPHVASKLQKTFSDLLNGINTTLTEKEVEELFQLNFHIFIVEARSLLQRR